jgi:hypothetical protein
MLKDRLELAGTTLVNTCGPAFWIMYVTVQVAAFAFGFWIRSHDSKP